MKYTRQLAALLCLLFLLVATLSTGCAQQKKPVKPQNIARKPPTTRLAPEVAKYKEEPQISVYRHATGKIEWMPLEKYLEGVVAGEVGTKPDAEALKAQAIVARTLTLALINYEGGVPKYKAMASDSHKEFQAYDEKAVTDDIRNAIKATRGQVILYNGKFAYALFSSFAAGKTASIEEGFPKLKAKVGPYIKVLPTAGYKYAPKKDQQWTARFSKAEVKAAMGNPATVDDIKIARRGPSGRVMTFTAGGKSVSGVDFRATIGPDRLKSTMITSVKASGNNIVFTGKGWGHGVGMEQWGAYAMARDGKKAADIIRYYFPGTSLTKLYR